MKLYVPKTMFVFLYTKLWKFLQMCGILLVN